MIVIWSIIALCGICSLILLSGRGSILIAGYNTMSKEESGAIRREKALPHYRNRNADHYLTYGNSGSFW